MNVALWGGIVAGLLAFLWVGSRAAASFRAGIRKEFREYLASARPDLVIAEERPDAFVLRDQQGGDAGTLFLHRLYREGSEKDADKALIFSRLVAALNEGAATESLSEADLDRLMPRLVTDRHLEQLRAEASRDLPAHSIGLEGLQAVVVLDNPNSVAYLSGCQLRELNLEGDAALVRAKANLAKTFSADVVRASVTGANLNVIKSFDSYDAARMLLVPAHLEAGESVVALVPDRDTLVLVRPPADGDWKSLWKLAKNAAGEPLFERPILVTSEGFREAPR